MCKEKNNHDPGAINNFHFLLFLGCGLSHFPGACIYWCCSSESAHLGCSGLPLLSDSSLALLCKQAAPLCFSLWKDFPHMSATLTWKHPLLKKEPLNCLGNEDLKQLSRQKDLRGRWKRSVSELASYVRLLSTSSAATATKTDFLFYFVLIKLKAPHVASGCHFSTNLGNTTPRRVKSRLMRRCRNSGLFILNLGAWF